MKKNRYDKEEDILGIQIKEGEYWKSVELPDGIVIDVSKNGEVISIEIHRASRIFSGNVRRVIESVGNRNN